MTALDDAIAAANNLRDCDAKREALLAERDRKIAQARLAGFTWREIFNGVKLTDQATRNAAERGNGGVLPQPK